MTKFGESKLFALNEVGIHNLLSLFLLISSSIGVQEIVRIVIRLQAGGRLLNVNIFVFVHQGPQLQNILLCLRLERLPAPRQSCLMKGHMSMVLLGMHQEYVTSNYVARILDQVSKVGSAEAKLPMLRLMAGTLEYICDKRQFLEYGGLTLMGITFFGRSQVFRGGGSRDAVD